LHQAAAFLEFDSWNFLVSLTGSVLRNAVTVANGTEVIDAKLTAALKNDTMSLQSIEGLGYQLLIQIVCLHGIS
jgi:hypothetical protein